MPSLEPICGSIGNDIARSILGGVWGTGANRRSTSSGASRLIGGSSWTLAVGVGDDCALINPSPGMQLALSSDMLVEGRHFFNDVSPYSLGHKALAVNLSDLNK